MALTVYEYANLTEHGEPVWPATTRTVGAVSPHRLASGTKYVGVNSSAAATLRVGSAESGQDATSADYKLEADKNYGIHVRPGTPTWLSFV